ncbi:MAG: hypothetical protein KDF59_09330 [Nitrosomonas sp.]|nr:hypothetical protein [Nitrosomonas sp.]
MKLNRMYLVVLGVLFSGCTTPSQVPIVKTDVVRVYPDLPDIEPLPPLTLMPFEWDYPRDTTKRVPKSTSKCLETPGQQRDESYWERCSEHPPLGNSNIFMGFSREDFETFLVNNEKIRARLLQYKARIDEINRQRAMWRQKNAETQQKLLSDPTEKQ